ncbi:hypothetical protein [Xenorhabdus koppenhoeferi]|uniref:hypothetical protein n=1 Tax=Xenorhabdus koppenhoeferi TaxID=351659 RepID=UPI002B4010A9|nr:hypothetical protein [Xenorhabdus sp. Vera]
MKAYIVKVALRGVSPMVWRRFRLSSKTSLIEHSRYRSVLGSLLEVVSGLIAYTFQPKKTSLNLRSSELALLKRS